VRQRINERTPNSANAGSHHRLLRARSSGRLVIGFRRTFSLLELLGSAPVSEENRRRKQGEGGSQIQIIDGPALEEISCECLAAVRRNIDPQ
jgi:hypothetical protein